MTTFDEKNLYFMKQNVLLHEYKMQKYVYNLNIVNIPKIIKYDKKNKIMTMQKITGMNLSDLYGEESKNISSNIFTQIRNIIKILLANNIEYSDITGYNFILDKNEELWIIDFEHAQYNTTITNSFVKKFCDGLDIWNPDYA